LNFEQADSFTKEHFYDESLVPDGKKSRSVMVKKEKKSTPVYGIIVKKGGTEELGSKMGS